MRSLSAFLLRFLRPVLLAFTSLLAACGGGGGSSNTTAPISFPLNTSAPTAVPTLAPSSGTTVSVGTTGQQAQLGPVGAGFSGEVAVPAAASGSGSIAIVLSSTAPVGAANISSVKRIPQTIGVTLTQLLFITFTASANITLNSSPSFSFTLPAGDSFSGGTLSYVGFLDPTSSSGWINLIGPGVAETSNVYQFAANTIPLTLKAGVTYTFGWYSTLSVVAPFATPSPSPSSLPTPMPGTGASLTGPNLEPGNNAYGPVAIANTFQFPVQSGFNGSGITVAVVGASNVFASDLTTYQSYFQIPQTGRSFGARPVDNAQATQVGSDITESTLDVETILGLAPGANVIDYVALNLSQQAFQDAYAAIISDNLARVVSISFTECESAIAPSSLSGENAIFANGAKVGIAFVAAAGDQGSACNLPTNPTTYETGVNYPASDPNVIGVGGIETSSNLSSTTAWNDYLASSQSQEASGGGISQAFVLPSYQAGIVGASMQFRNVPDIALPAVYGAAFVQGQWQPLNGTSWSAPQFAAMLAEIYQYCGDSNGITNATGLPYIASSLQSSSFIDVLTGNNAFSLTSGYTTAYSAHAGYDNVSGIGVPLGMPMANTLCPNRVLVGRARAQSSRRAAPQSLDAYQADATPQFPGILDIGRRGPTENTRIQIVVADNGSMSDNEQKVIAALSASGFSITRTFGNHLIVDATAPSSAVERLFSTVMHNIAQSSDTAYLPVTKITIPASLAPYIAGVTLDDLIV